MQNCSFQDTILDKLTGLLQLTSSAKIFDLIRNQIT